MFLKNFLLSYIFLFCMFISVSHAETDPALTASGQWKDKKTGLIWLKCKVNEKLVNSTCVNRKVSKELIYDQAQKTVGSLDGDDFTYAEAQKTIAYLNSKNFKGSSKWRLPTISELASLRQCSNGWDKQQEKIQIPKGNQTISIPLKCAEDKVFNVFSKIFPMIPGYSSSMIWTSTSAGKDAFNNSLFWNIHATNGQIISTNTDSYSAIFLVRSE